MSVESVLMPLAGGVLIGLASALLLAMNGKIAGISGIVDGALKVPEEEESWRYFFIAGLLSGGLGLLLFYSDAFPAAIRTPLPLVLAAGFLVGVGTRMGSGCTSGHGICGLSRFSPRSLVATVSFMGAGFLTVAAMRHLFGGLA